jgi:geranylgeranylglycerol-phosphate geranylgeranyltransferase
MKKIRLLWHFSRPFTLIPPVVGIISGALVGVGATRSEFRWPPILLAALAAATLNAASNGLNQICDLENDRLNKPKRPLPSGQLSLGEAMSFTTLLYLMSIVLVAFINTQVLVIYLVAAVATYLYSARPFRLKSRTFLSNFTIALIRGNLLKVAGWAAIASVTRTLEPWYIGSIFMLFLMGATTTKDFADVDGDRAAGCITLPVRYGAATSARLISPFFIFPWLLLPVGIWTQQLSANPTLIFALGAVMALWGTYVAYLINRNPISMVSQGENHPSWRQMYWMMMTGHIGLGVIYLVH